MGSEKKPVRMCVACREGKEKNELVRVVKTPDGRIEIDMGGRANGRGAYLCKNRMCIETACKKKQLSRAFRMEVPREVYHALMELADE